MENIDPRAILSFLSEGRGAAHPLSADRRKRRVYARQDVSRLNVTYYFNGPSVPITVVMRDNPLPSSLPPSLSLSSLVTARRGKAGVAAAYYVEGDTTIRGRRKLGWISTCGQSTCIKLTPHRTSTCSRVRECSKARH